MSQWTADVHGGVQSRFDDYLGKAQLMFGPAGLGTLSVPGKAYLWERALLACGDYLMLSPKRSNYSFLMNPAGWNSWKRYLRGETSGQSPKRRHLKALWDRIDAKTTIAPQLDQIIRGRSGLEPWREAVVKHPEVIGYCEQREIRRREYVEEIYLLKKTQMNGTHAELFSYALYQELTSESSRQKLAPLKLLDYQFESKTETEPSVQLYYELPW